MAGTCIHDWRTDRTYRMNELVQYNNVVYKCLVRSANTNPEDTEHWLPLFDVKAEMFLNPQSTEPTIEKTEYVEKTEKGELPMAEDMVYEGHRYRKGSDGVWKVIAAVKDAEAEMERANAGRFINTIQDIKDAETRLTAQVVEDRFQGQKGFAEVSHELCEGFSGVEGSLNAGFRDVTAQVTHNSEANAHSFGDVKTQNALYSGETQRLVQLTSDNGQRLTQLVGDNVLRQNQLTSDATQRLMQSVANITDTLILTNASESRIQVEKISAELRVQADKNAFENLLQFKEVQITQERIAAAAARDAAANAAAIAAQLCECCCELKEKISAEADETRELLNATKMQDLRDSLADAKNRLVEESHRHNLESVYNKITQVGLGNVAIPTAVRS